MLTYIEAICFCDHIWGRFCKCNKKGLFFERIYFNIPWENCNKFTRIINLSVGLLLFSTVDWCLSLGGVCTVKHMGIYLMNCAIISPPFWDLTDCESTRNWIRNKSKCCQLMSKCVFFSSSSFLLLLSYYQG